MADKNVTVKLNGADGSQLRLVIKVPNKVRSKFAFEVAYATAKNGDGRRTHSRGASSVHDTLDQATAALTAARVAAVKVGWLLQVKTTKADAFTLQTLPKPGPAPAPKPDAKK